MQIGDIIIHRATGKRMTVRRLDGSEFVLCCWLEERTGGGGQVECSAAYKWDQLRSPTPSEVAGVAAAPSASAVAAEPVTVPAEEPEAVSDTGAEPEPEPAGHKQRRR